MAPLYAPWLEVAIRELVAQVSEVDGPKSNHRILEYHSATGLKSTSDEVPWCSSFVCWCLRTAWVRGTNSARARSFESWGVALREPKPGCIVVMWRRSRDSGKGHVGFWLGRHHTARRSVLVLGGNQGDKVSVQGYDEDHVLTYRWPGQTEWLVA